MEKRSIEERIAQKIEQIEEYLSFLDSIAPKELEEYKRDLKTKAACERYAEKIIEASIDMAFFVVNLKKLPQPIEEDTIFTILSKSKIISQDLEKKLNNAKGMRNFIIHQYGEISDEIVFEAVSYELKKDIEDFLNVVKRMLEEIK